MTSNRKLEASREGKADIFLVQMDTTVRTGCEPLEQICEPRTPGAEPLLKESLSSYVAVDVFLVQMDTTAQPPKLFALISRITIGPSTYFLLLLIKMTS